jgi:hypothetical protein
VGEARFPARGLLHKNVIAARPDLKAARSGILASTTHLKASAPVDADNRVTPRDARRYPCDIERASVVRLGL